MTEYTVEKKYVKKPKNTGHLSGLKWNLRQIFVPLLEEAFTVQKINHL